MAGLGRKVFTPGEVLTATNVQNYLMDQAVQVYAGTAARGSAIGSATTEGMVSYLQDYDALQVATGTATWVNVGSLLNLPGTAARNALFPSPTQFDAVFRDDLGYQETYLDTYNAGSNPLGAATAGWYPYPSTSLSRVEGSVVSNSTTSGVIKFVLPTIPFRAKVFGKVYLKQSLSYGAGNTGVTFGFGTTTGGVGTWSVTTGFTSFSAYPGGAALSNTMLSEFVVPVTANITANTTPDFRMTWSIANLTGLSSAGPTTGFFIEYYLEPFRS